MKLKFLLAILFLCHSVWGGFNDKTPEEFSYILENSKDKLIDREERYINLEKAVNTIKPDDILKIGITYSYKDAINPFYMEGLDVSPLPLVQYDRSFIYEVAPHITNYVLVDDSHEFVLKKKTLGGKDQIKNLINEKKGQKKVALVFFSGHGTPEGKTPIPTHTKECKKLFKELQAKYETRSSPPAPRPSLTTDWKNSECKNENYILSMNDYKQFLAPLDIVMINDSDHSGIYLDLVNKGEFAGLIHSTSKDSPTNYYPSYSDYPGGALMAELRKRLKATIGCKLDGTNQRPKDRILDLQEWTTDIKNLKYANYQADPQVKKQNMGLYVVSSQDLIKSIPIHIYTSAECKDQPPVSTTPWEAIKSRYPHSSKSVETLSRQARIVHSMEMLSIGIGQAFGVE